jgi:two-component system sensor histidine kinase YesM
MARIFHPLSSIRNRLIVILTVVPLSVMALFFAILSKNVSQIVEKRIHDNFELKLEINSMSLIDTLNNACDLTACITFDGSNVGEQLDAALTSTNVVTRAKLLGYIQKTLYTYLHSAHDIGVIALIDTDNNQVVIATEPLARADLACTLIPLTSWRRATLYAPHRTLCYLHNNTVISMSKRFNTILPGRNYEIYIETSAHFLDKLLDPVYNSDHTSFCMDKALLSEDGTILCSSDDSLLPTGMDMEMLKQSGALKHCRILEAREKGWIMLGVVDESYYQRVYSPMYMQVLWTMTACATIFIALALLIWHLVYTPIREFASEIRNMKPNGVFLPRANTSELNEIRLQINQMYNAIRELLVKAETEAQKSARLENELLLSRINPHFLHNTLDNIKWLARQNNQQEVADMLATLNKLIYYNLGKQRITTLKDELGAMDGYLFLQNRIRPFTYNREINLSEDALSTHVPCYMLQPLVENSIRHARCEKLVLTVSITENDKHLYIRVSDNGQGMDEETLARLQELAEAERPEDSGIGLKYVLRALRMMYGRNVQTHITSDQVHGTSVLIMIER